MGIAARKTRPMATPVSRKKERLSGVRYAEWKPSRRLLITPEAAQSASTRATNSRVMDFCPRARNCASTSCSVPGGRTFCKASERVLQTKPARVMIRIVATDVSTGKNESSAE